MKRQKRNKNIQKKMINKGKIAAIAGLTLSAGMVLSDVAPALAAAQPGQPGTQLAPAQNGGNAGDTNLPVEPTGSSSTGSGQQPAGSTPQPESPVTTPGSGDEQGGKDPDTNPNKAWKIVNGNELVFQNETLTDNNIFKGSFDINEKAKIKTITFEGKVTAASDVSNLLQGFTNLTTINNLENLDTSKSTNFSFLFANDKNLTNIDLSKINTQNATNMRNMFSYSGISSINLADLNTSKVTDMSNMFEGTPITSIDLSKMIFAPNVQTTGMFDETNITDLIVSKDTPLNKLNFPTNKKDKKLQWSEYTPGDFSKTINTFAPDDLKNADLSKIDVAEFKLAPKQIDTSAHVKITVDGQPDQELKIDGITGDANSDLDITDKLPAKPGYYLKKAVMAHINDDKSVTVYDVADYTDTISDTTIPVVSSDDSTFKTTGTIKKQKLTNNNTVSVIIPAVEGYDFDKTATVKVDKFGKLPKDVQISTSLHVYSKLTAAVTDPNGQKLSATVNAKSGKIGDKVVVTIPNVDGYVYPKTVQGTVGKDGIVSIPQDTPIYSTKKTDEKSVATITQPDGKTKKITESGKTCNADFEIPVKEYAVPGYDVDLKDHITAHVEMNGTITIKQQPKFTRKHFSQTVSIDLPNNGTHSFKIEGDANSNVKVALPSIHNYDKSDDFVMVHIDADNTIHDDQLKKISDEYTPIQYQGTVLVSSNILDVPAKVSGVANSTIDFSIPQLNGYQSDIKTAKVHFDDNGKPSIVDETLSVTYTPINPGQQTITLPSNFGDISIELPKVNLNTTMEYVVPKKDGYKLDHPTVTIVVNAKGQISIKEGSVKYNPVSADADVTINTNLGSKTIHHVKGSYGTPVSITVPPVTGYKPDKEKISATVKPDGEISLDKPNDSITYSKKDLIGSVDVLCSDNQRRKISNITGKIGDTKTVDVPTIKGYTPNIAKVDVKINEDGTFSLKNPDQVISYSFTRTLSVKCTKDSKNYFDKQFDVTYALGGKTKFDVNTPLEPGYNPFIYRGFTPFNAMTVNVDKKKLSISIDHGWGIGTWNHITYNPIQRNDRTVFANTSDGPKLLHIDKITFNNPLELSVPEKTGYTPDSKVKVQLNADGNVELVDPHATVNYKINHHTDNKFELHSNLGDLDPNYDKTKVTFTVEGDYNQTINVKVPDVDGYTHEMKTIAIHLDKNNKFVTDVPGTKIHYKPIEATKDVVIPSNSGDVITNGSSDPKDWTTGVTFKKVHLVYGTPTKLKVQPKKGYISNLSEITVNLGKDKNVIIPDGTKIVYSPNKVTADATVKTNMGDFVSKNMSGVVGQHLTITLPVKKGYTADKKTVDATVNADGTITVKDSVNYIKNRVPKPELPSISHNDINNIVHHKVPNIIHSIKVTINHIIRKISLLLNKAGIKLYRSDSSEVTTRSLASGTDWFSDEEMVRDGVTYYRVSSNEWVRADEAYSYTPQMHVVTTKPGTVKALVNSQGKLSNRALAKNSAWKSDRTIQINGKTYYRVSTDEFVSADDVIVK